MNPANLTLSQKEAELIRNADWILTKNGILEKVKNMLADLQVAQQAHLSGLQLPRDLTSSSPKISRGENYGGLPYLILDFPRFFEQDNTFAVRTMFWWGNFFSITLHLSGSHKRKYQERIIASYPLLKDGNYYSCIQAEEWHHHFEPGNYKKVSAMQNEEFGNAVRERSFIKLAYKISLEEWEKVQGILLARFIELIKLIST